MEHRLVPSEMPGISNFLETRTRRDTKHIKGNVKTLFAERQEMNRMTNKKVVELVLQSTKESESWNKASKSGWYSSVKFFLDEKNISSAVIHLPSATPGKKHQTIVEFKESKKATSIWAREYGYLIKKVESFADTENESVKKRYTEFAEKIKKEKAIVDSIFEASSILSPDEITPSTSSEKGVCLVKK